MHYLTAIAHITLKKQEKVLPFCILYYIYEYPSLPFFIISLLWIELTRTISERQHMQLVAETDKLGWIGRMMRK